MAHYDSFRINIAIMDMNRLTAKILDVINDIHNINFTIKKRIYVIPPPQYLDWFEIYYPIVPFN